MPRPRLGLWMIGAYGGVATTVAVGLAALRKRLIEPVGLATALPALAIPSLPDWDEIVIGGHDIRRTTFEDSAHEFRAAAGVLDEKLIQSCRPILAEWDKNVVAGTVRSAGEQVARLQNWKGKGDRSTQMQVVEDIASDLERFRARHKPDHLLVFNLASTEPPLDAGSEHQTWAALAKLLKVRGKEPLPASSLYALGAIEAGAGYINFTPSAGIALPALEERAQARKLLYGGQDGKTGETLLKTVLAPMFAQRNLKVMSWVGHNIFGNRDGLVLDNPENKKSKIRSKDKAVSQILGYAPQTHVSIEYIASLDDWKTAWDHIHFQGFLGAKMVLQFTWQGCDSLLAAPLVLDMARLFTIEAQAGRSGLMKHLACFFKSPMGVAEADFHLQFDLLLDHLRQFQHGHRPVRS